MRKLYRNIAIVTSIFMLVMVVMMGVSYYQMQQVSPLQSEVMQTLKELNEANGDNEALQQQVRQLDLLSRKAYFVKEGQVKTGLYILLAMAGVLIVSLNLYYRGTKTLPDKELDPVDEWMNKSRSRKYITWASAGAAAAVLAMVVLQHVDVGNLMKKVKGGNPIENVAEVQQQAGQSEAGDSLQAVADTVKTDSTALVAVADSVEAKEEVDSLPIPKITSNAFRGNNSLGISSARGIPNTWDLKSKKNVLWQSKIPKHGYN